MIEHAPDCPDNSPGFRQMHCTCDVLARANGEIERLREILRLLRNTRGMDELTKEQADTVEAAPAGTEAGGMTTTA